MERISWYCRDHKTPHDTGDGSAEIIFSNRSGMAYEELRAYLDHLQQHPGVSDVRIAWVAIKTDQMIAYRAGQRRGLQIADAVAGSFFYAVEPTKYGFSEDRYARMLKPVVYHREGRYRGYGVKLCRKRPNQARNRGSFCVDSRDVLKSEGRFRASGSHPLEAAILADDLKYFPRTPAAGQYPTAWVCQTPKFGDMNKPWPKSSTARR